MTHVTTVRRWLEEHGWYAGREVRERIDEHLAFRPCDTARQGFLRTYGLLRLPYPKAPRDRPWASGPTPAARAAPRTSPSRRPGLGWPVFPVAHEPSEGGIVLLDDLERVFYLHGTGPYFLGHDAHEAFARRLSGRTLRDAADLYA
ncbi:SUKH-3 domain-containing protein [Actinacidiphila glaucinigra]|uniref:SUKH-3 domain-containing protein n=1 Tax=Actinacidiphila glaucinigra TaxID=235986 RepID=UPI0034113573